MAEVKQRDSRIFEREEHEHYVEEAWCGPRLFQEVKFEGPILDPFCGWGRILSGAIASGHQVLGSDIVNRSPLARGCPVGESLGNFRQLDFLALHKEEVYQWWQQAGAIVGNPPFKKIRECAMRALSLMKRQRGKVAFIFPLRRLPAATWLEETPLAKVLFMNPRPSMPTGSFIEAAERGEINPETGEPYKVGGGTQDFCWVIWDHKINTYQGLPTCGWLRRDVG